MKRFNIVYIVLFLFILVACESERKETEVTFQETSTTEVTSVLPTTISEEDNVSNSSDAEIIEKEVLPYFYNWIDEYIVLWDQHWKYPWIEFYESETGSSQILSEHMALGLKSFSAHAEKLENVSIGISDSTVQEAVKAANLELSRSLLFRGLAMSAVSNGLSDSHNTNVDEMMENTLAFIEDSDEALIRAWTLIKKIEEEFGIVL